MVVVDTKIINLVDSHADLLDFSSFSTSINNFSWGTLILGGYSRDVTISALRSIVGQALDLGYLPDGYGLLAKYGVFTVDKVSLHGWSGYFVPLLDGEVLGDNFTPTTVSSLPVIEGSDLEVSADDSSVEPSTSLKETIIAKVLSAKDRLVSSLSGKGINSASIAWGVTSFCMVGLIFILAGASSNIKSSSASVSTPKDSNSVGITSISSSFEKKEKSLGSSLKDWVSSTFSPKRSDVKVIDSSSPNGEEARTNGGISTSSTSTSNGSSNQVSSSSSSDTSSISSTVVAPDVEVNNSVSVVPSSTPSVAPSAGNSSVPSSAPQYSSTIVSIVGDTGNSTPTEEVVDTVPTEVSTASVDISNSAVTLNEGTGSTDSGSEVSTVPSEVITSESSSVEGE